MFDTPATSLRLVACTVQLACFVHTVRKASVQGLRSCFQDMLRAQVCRLLKCSVMADGNIRALWPGYAKVPGLDWGLRVNSACAAP